MPDDSAAAAPRDPDEEVRSNHGTHGTHGRERRTPGGTNHESRESLEPHESYKGSLIREIRVIRGGSASFFPVALRSASAPGHTRRFGPSQSSERRMSSACVTL